MTEDSNFPFTKFEVWQLSVDLADFVSERLEALPKNRFVILISQLEAAICRALHRTSLKAKEGNTKRNLFNFFISRRIIVRGPNLSRNIQLEKTFPKTG